MKIFLILFLVSTIYAGDLKLASNIFEKIILAISHDTKPKIYIYTHIEAIEEYSEKFNLVNSCEDSDIVILSSVKKIPSRCSSKLLFGTRYKHLKNKKVIGAFFWQKGRPNILFYRDRLEKNNIKLDSSFDKYIENE